MARNVSDAIIPLDFNSNPLPALKDVFGIEIDKKLNDIDILKFSTLSEQIRVEQNIIYKNKRYIVSVVDEMRDAEKKYRSIECMAAHIELSSRIVQRISFQAVSISNGLEKILSGTGWTVGTIENEGDMQHSMQEENQTVLWLIRQFAKITGYEAEFDTIRRQVNFRRTIGKDSGIVFHYRKNIREIKKTTFIPTATVIYPRGRGGLTIEAVNDGKEYLEDYSWYESLGIPLQEARDKYKKEYIWEDDRFIYAGDLLRAAQEKLRELSHPQIAYEANVSEIGAESLDIGDFAYIVDDELGIKVKVRVVRLREFPRREWNNQIEFNYLVPELGGVESASTSPDTYREQMLLAKNQSSFSIGSNYQNIMELAVTAYAPTNVQAGLMLTGQASEKTTFIAYFTFKGQQVGPEIRQTVEGWTTIGIPFLLTQIPEGSGFLSLFAKVENGTFTIEKEKAQLFIKAENLLGGLSAKLPKADVREEVEFVKITTPILDSFLPRIETTGAYLFPASIDGGSTSTFDLSAYIQDIEQFTSSVSTTFSFEGVAPWIDTTTKKKVAIITLDFSSPAIMLLQNELKALGYEVDVFGTAAVTTISVDLSKYDLFVLDDLQPFGTKISLATRLLEYLRGGVSLLITSLSAVANGDISLLSLLKIAESHEVQSGHAEQTIASIHAITGNQSQGTAVTLYDNSNHISSFILDTFSYAGTPLLTVQKRPVITLSYDFETEAPNWTYIGGNWELTDIEKHSGSYSLRSPVISHNQQTQAELTVTLIDDGTVSFWYKVDSESGYDKFRFYVDGAKLREDSGTGKSWTQVTYQLSPGTHTLRFEYINDGSASRGYDCVFIDDLVITGVQGEGVSETGITSLAVEESDLLLDNQPAESRVAFLGWLNADALNQTSREIFINTVKWLLKEL